MFNIGPGEVVVLLMIGLILFGPKPLPELLETFRQRMPVTPDRGRWTPFEWALVAAMVSLAAIAAASLSRGL